MRLNGVAEIIKNEIRSKRYAKLRPVWEFINIGILNLNSFLLLYYRAGGRNSMKYVICAGAAGYTLILLAQFLLYRRHPNKMAAFQKTKNIFRLIYTAIYLTVIMLDVLVIAEQPGTEYILVGYGWMFIWVTVWGTKCFWLKKIVHRMKVHFMEKNLCWKRRKKG